MSYFYYTCMECRTGKYVCEKCGRCGRGFTEDGMCENIHAFPSAHTKVRNSDKNKYLKGKGR